MSSATADVLKNKGSGSAKTEDKPDKGSTGMVKKAASKPSSKADVLKGAGKMAAVVDAMPYVPSHERKDGWHKWELEDASRHLEQAERIRGNKGLVEAIAKHHETRATEHKKLAASAKSALARGLISESALAKATGGK